MIRIDDAHGEGDAFPVPRPLLVLDIVALTGKLLKHTPRIAAVAKDGFCAPLEPVLPAVTCSVQATLLTGLPPSGHGIVGNGWYFRDLAQVMFWRQANGLVSGEKVWEAARARWSGFRTAQLFWWFNMYSTAEIAVTPRPAYPADGRKLPDLYTKPAGLARALQAEFGAFPLFRFWGPAAGILSSEWIAGSSAALLEREKPDLPLVYLPHLDYDLQRFGPDSPEAVRACGEIDRVAGDLIDRARGLGYDVVVLSEYGIEPASQPVHLNRVLRRAGLLAVQETPHGELLDCGACRAFAVADHQVAHVHVPDVMDVTSVKALLEATPGVDRVLDEAGKRECGLAHPRSGELVALAAPGAWFTYYYWLSEAARPDFAPTVDIHRKPGYDPAELFLDPDRPLVKGRVAFRLLQKTLGFRYLMDVIPTRGEMVKGTHGRMPSSPEAGPVFLSSARTGERERVKAVEVKGMLLGMLAEGR